MENIREFLSIIVGITSTIGMPALVSFLKQNDWPEWKKAGIAILSAISLGALTTLVRGEWDLENLTLTITSIFTAATFIYHSFFKGTAWDVTLTAKKVL